MTDTLDRLNLLDTSVDGRMRSGEDGQLDVCRVRLTQAANEPLRHVVDAEIKGVSLSYQEFPYRVRSASGSLRITPDRVVLNDIRGVHGASPVGISGRIDLPARGEGPPDADGPQVHLELHGTGVAMDDALYEALPDSVRKVWDDLRPNGSCDVRATLDHTGGAAEELQYDVAVTPRELSVRYRHFPILLENLTGRIRATNGEVRLEKVGASGDGRTVELSGAVAVRDEIQEGRLTLLARKLPVNEELLAAFPNGLEALAGRFKPGGTMGLDLTSLRFRSEPVQEGTGPRSGGGNSEPARETTWSVEGVVSLDEVTVDLGLESKSLSGTFTGLAGQGEDGLTLDGALDLENVAIGPRKITRLSGKLHKAPDKDLVTIRSMAGSAHGGRLAGMAEIRLGDTVEYGVSLELDGIDLNDLFNAGIDDPRKRADVKGKLTGRISLVSASDKTEDLRAEGVLQIRRAKLYKLPVLLGFLHVVYLTLPSGSAFTEGDIRYEIRKGKLVLNEIRMRGSALSVVGSGNMDLDTESLRLTFLAGPPAQLPSIGITEELLSIIAKELVEIRVTGTLSKPKLNTVPLRSLETIFRILLDPTAEAPS